MEYESHPMGGFVYSGDRDVPPRESDQSLVSSTASLNPNSAALTEWPSFRHSRKVSKMTLTEAEAA